MESLKSPGLYFVGEVLDVSGHLGGFNFQWAGRRAARRRSMLSGYPHVRRLA